jgi:hypothetical protein
MFLYKRLLYTAYNITTAIRILTERKEDNGALNTRRHAVYAAAIAVCDGHVDRVRIVRNAVTDSAIVHHVPPYLPCTEAVVSID